MRAWRVHEHGEPLDVLTLEEAPDPVPGPGEALIDVEAAGVNFADLLLCRGTYQERPAMPFSPGLEVAGTIVAVGAGGDDDAAFAPGDRVVGATALPAGGFAERAVVRLVETHPLPGDLPGDAAAAMHVTYQTAWFALHRRTAVDTTSTVVVHGAAGGLGSACLRLAVAAGARVVATVAGAEKARRCRALGAVEVVDTAATTDLVTALREAVGPTGADIVLDPVGGALFEASTRAVAFEGTIVVLGAAGGDYAPARTNHLLVKNYAVSGLHWGAYRRRRPDLCRRAHDELVELWRAGRIDDDISRRAAMTELPALVEDLLTRRTVGKSVLLPGR